MSTNTARADHLILADQVIKGERVLDIGCGDGQLMELLRSKRGADVRGLEISPERVGKCLIKGLPVVQGDAEKDLRVYPDDAFDCAILSRAIQTMQHPDAILRELWRIAPRVLVSIHNYGYWRTRLSLLFSGRMPAPAANGTWYSNSGKHPCSLLDLIELATGLGYEFQHSIPVGGNPKNKTIWQNIFARETVLVLRRSPAKKHPCGAVTRQKQL